MGSPDGGFPEGFEGSGRHAKMVVYENYDILLSILFAIQKV